MEIRKEKSEIRRTFLAARANLTEDERRVRDAKICKTIISMASFRYADTILMYAPTNLEPEIMSVATEAWRRGKNVAFPKCDTPARSMTYHIVCSEDELIRGAYNILEPSGNAPRYDVSKSAFCLVPALVFDKDGYRVGYGKGYYDRFLTKFSGSAAGVIYSDFICGRVPRGRYDVALKILVTEKGVRLINEN